jgi:arylsulfatase A-like enzyme
MRAAYAAMITRMDREVGRVLQLIKELGLDERTMIVFTSDNGPLYDQLGGTDSEFFNSAGGLRGRKGSYYEGGFRVPCSFVGGQDCPSSSATATGFEDWLPTLLDLIGERERIPAGIDGLSFAPTLRGENSRHAPSSIASRPATAASNASGSAIGRPFAQVESGQISRHRGINRD